MTIFFPKHPYIKGAVEPDFESELAAANLQGFSIVLFDYDSFIADSILHVNKSSSPQEAIYRGWMMKPVQYQLFYDALKEQGYELINSPIQYTNCHYFPEVFPYIKGFSPKAKFVELPVLYTWTNEKIKNFIDFGGSDFIIKDYVKSEKGTSVFRISSSVTVEEFKNIVSDFLRLRHKQFNLGIVLKEFVELKKYGEFTNEWRVFVYRGEMMSATYNVSSQVEAPAPELGFLQKIIPQINSNFFTIDLAQKADGSWFIIECGDGGVSGLTPHTNEMGFFAKIKEREQVRKAERAL